ncbi:ADP-forming succinate--CoA ligase subunit beta [Ignicoccus hospitalis]|uniref:Succinate--CoA ligase [ADP-forming] subunit beta n=1 Tax=Ignicoccus hospitalis (strain KIN4/I / DSM 18386 / JCM 14125) TaxID=453591 RepID=SUCC_IGNH4|nr:ADP-forming succinate--CoA ligase subunit beta [Ignicoccus hospitalis]A8A8L8.1 RecName: Full=Succinate--CoA ligase [ADP-forming] subunit beta; AltName: Full=Succinyl-CoA synthetase subunit beta; Short=SCS-beta [Ignicoccus hospitalis KIN4/I]ABU81270.1 succinyl-CoA synthetase (ADP-forming) beta subunit [Ignicoccus hospitalis KIN4/I]HIH90952.1 ADP-forming succinate--CoA ligase subunit beta [Desulfurococcaceae archaeon]
MNLLEYEAKAIAKKYGIPTPEGVLIERPEQVNEAVEKLGLPVVLKAQVPVAGRGKAGGVKLARDPDEALELAEELFSKEIKGFPVLSLLVEKAENIQKELYLSFTIDRTNRKVVMLASAEGGMEIEELAKEKPDAIVKLPIEPEVGLKAHEAREVGKRIGLSGQLLRQFEGIAKTMYKIFEDYDAELVESNPLAITDRGLVALDFRMIVDDNAIFRHPELEASRERELSELEKEAARWGFFYVELDGDIGIIGNGAGLTMATMDVVNYYGGRPANFLDIGGGARRDRVKAAVNVLLKNPKVKVIFVNIFGGITLASEVAQGIVDALSESNVKKPIVARIVGTAEEEGKKILKEAGIPLFESMDEAAQEAVKLAKAA